MSLDEQGSGWARFRCETCSEVAGTVLLPNPDGITITGFIGECHLTIDPASASAIKEALEQRDAAALYSMSYEWAPFYCPDCEAIYCVQHWITEIRFDEDDPGWYDATYGTCPNGHRHLLDD